MNHNLGNIKLKQIILGLILIIFIFMSGCHMPFLARYAQRKIKIGMTATEVKSTLDKMGRYYLYCEVGKKGVREEMFDDRKCVETLVSITGNNEIDNARMNVTFMGPVFLKNDFKITFGKKGKVTAKTPVRSWD